MFRLFICPDCGSADITVPATSWWDDVEQAWAWEQNDRSMYCHTCESEILGTEKEITIDTKRQTRIPQPARCCACVHHDKENDPVPWAVLEDYDEVTDKWKRKCRDLPFWLMEERRYISNDVTEVECSAFKERNDEDSS